MDPVTLAIIFGVGSFGVAKMSGASNKQALIAGGIGALGGYAGGGGFAGAGGEAAKQNMYLQYADTAAKDAAITSTSGGGLSGLGDRKSVV